jgi:MATE family multidrug resistance protein
MLFISIFRGPGIAPEHFREVGAYARLLLKLIALATVFDAWNTTFSGALKGAGDTWFAMWANVVLAWCVFVPPVYVTTVVWPQPIVVPWAFLVLYVFLLGVVYWARFAGGHWQHIEIRERRVPALVSELSGEAALLDT